MVPSFIDESRNYGVYGPMEAVKWFRDRSGCQKRNKGSVRLKIHEITEGNFSLSGSEMETLRDKIKRDASLRKQFEEVK